MQENELIKNAESVTDMTPDYLAAIKELKAKSVDKEDYEKLQDENRKLLQSLVNGQTMNQPEPEINIEKSDVYRDQVDHAQTNLEFITAVCNYRDAVLKESGEDIFTIHKPGEQPDEFEKQAAIDTADVFKQCIEDAEGNPQVFNGLLQKRFVDSTNSYRR